MHRKSARTTGESNKRSNSRKAKMGYDWVNGIPAWTSVTDCKGDLNGVELHRSEQLWPPVAETHTARHQSVSQHPISQNHETNGEDRRQISALHMMANSTNAAQDETLQFNADGNGRFGGYRPSSMINNEPSHSSSIQIQHFPNHSSSRGPVNKLTLLAACSLNDDFRFN